MLQRALIAALNHLLSNEMWARDHLKGFAGQTARIELPPVVLDLAITPEGGFVRSDAASPPTVTITIPASAVFRLTSGLETPETVFGAALVKGPADLTDCLGFVFRNLRWDIESDLAPLVGDIVAHRLVWFSKHFADWQRQQMRNLARNFAEYCAEEARVVTTRADVAEYCREVDSLAAPLHQLEARISSLESLRQR